MQIVEVLQQMKTRIRTAGMVALFAIVLTACTSTQGSLPATTGQSSSTSVDMVDSAMEEGADKPMSMESGEAMQMEQRDSMMKEDPANGESMDAEQHDAMMDGREPKAMSEQRYTDYSPAVLERATRTGRAVLFFKANWCPTCAAADAEFRANLEEIPADVTVLRVDYDTAKELKTKLRITYQHTFVQVDGNGDQIARWNGGGLRELRSSLK